MQWQRVEKPEYGYAVHVPDGWVERPPDLKNSPVETARFADPRDRRHGLTVFRGMPRPNVTAVQAAESARNPLEAAGYRGFEITEAPVAGRDGARLECALHDAGRVWAVREYFVVDNDVRFVIGCGSAVPAEDEQLFTAIAERFEILDVAAVSGP